MLWCIGKPDAPETVKSTANFEHVDHQLLFRFVAFVHLENALQTRVSALKQERKHVYLDMYQYKYSIKALVGASLSIRVWVHMNDACGQKEIFSSQPGFCSTLTKLESQTQYMISQLKGIRTFGFQQPTSQSSRASRASKPSTRKIHIHPRTWLGVTWLTTCDFTKQICFHLQIFGLLGPTSTYRRTAKNIPIKTWQAPRIETSGWKSVWKVFDLYKTSTVRWPYKPTVHPEYSLDSHRSPTFSPPESVWKMS